MQSKYETIDRIWGSANSIKIRAWKMTGDRFKSGLVLKPTSSILLVFCSLFILFPSTTSAGSAFNIIGARPLYFGGLRDLATRFEEKTGIKVLSKAGGCMAALKAVEIPSKRSVGAWCCPVPGALDKKMDIVRIPVAMDAIVVYVHPSNPVDNISMDQLQGVYSGVITNWSQVGGPAKPIVPLVRRHCENLPEVFRKKVVGSWFSHENSADWLEVKSIEKMIENVEKFRLAIGYESFVFAKKDSVKILNVNGIAPTAENIRSKRYPFWRVLSLGVHKSLANDPVVKKFLEFTLSAEGQEILGRKLVSISKENL